MDPHDLSSHSDAHSSTPSGCCAQTPSDGATATDPVCANMRGSHMRFGAARCVQIARENRDVSFGRWR